MNQALEDVYTLTLLLTSISKTNTDKALLQTLSFWQRIRQRRIDAIFDWVNSFQNIQRMPEAERRKLVEEGKIKEDREGDGDDMSWLYRPTIQEGVNDWLTESSS